MIERADTTDAGRPSPQRGPDFAGTPAALSSDGDPLRPDAHPLDRSTGGGGWLAEQIRLIDIEEGFLG